MAPSDLGGSFAPELIGDDTVTVEGGSYDSADAGSRTVTGSMVAGTDVGNYTVTLGTIAGNIAKKELTVTAAVLTKVYDGSTAAAGAAIASGGVVSGAVGAQSLTLTVVSGTYASAGVANVLSITSPVFELTGADNASKPDNYSLPGTIAATGNITKKTISAISGVTVISRTADGSKTAAFDTSAADGTGVVDSEVSDFRGGGLAVSGEFPSADAGTHSLSVTYSLVDNGGFKAGNYMLGSSAQSGTLSGTLNDQPPSTKTYKITSAVTANEGANAALTVTLGEPAPSSGIAFDVSYDYSGSAATGDDTGATPSTVTGDRRQDGGDAHRADRIRRAGGPERDVHGEHRARERRDRLGSGFRRHGHRHGDDHRHDPAAALDPDADHGRDEQHRRRRTPAR